MTDGRIREEFDYRCVFVSLSCTYLLPEVYSPGDISVGVVFFIGALVKLSLDGFCLNGKLPRNCTKNNMTGVSVGPV